MYRKYTYTLRKVKKAGKKDGKTWRWAIWPPQWPFWETKEPIPPIDQEEPSEYEKELVKAGDELTREVANEWEKMDRKLKEEYCSSEKELINAKRTLEKEKGEHKEAIEEYERAREKFYKIPKAGRNRAGNQSPLYLLCGTGRSGHGKVQDRKI